MSSTTWDHGPGCAGAGRKDAFASSVPTDRHIQVVLTPCLPAPGRTTGPTPFGRTSVVATPALTAADTLDEVQLLAAFLHYMVGELLRARTGPQSMGQIMAHEALQTELLACYDLLARIALNNLVLARLFQPHLASCCDVLSELLRTGRRVGSCSRTLYVRRTLCSMFRQGGCGKVCLFWQGQGGAGRLVCFGREEERGRFVCFGREERGGLFVAAGGRSGEVCFGREDGRGGLFVSAGGRSGEVTALWL